jgi:two-component system alkaline phosphatase synthesis response regulator PhoP
MKKKILIAEDDVDLADMLDYNLRQEGFITRAVGNGLEVMAAARAFRPDLVILDLMLPGVDGFEVCKRLKSDQRTLDIPILILTVKSSEVDVVLGLELGADDYVTKPFSVRVLLARIRSILRRLEDYEKVHHPINYYALFIDCENRQVLLDQRRIEFSKTEFDILALLASRPGRVFSRNQILERCWPDGVFVVDRAVDVHINSIRRKLGKMGQHIETVRGIGYRMRD